MPTQLWVKQATVVLFMSPLFLYILSGFTSMEFPAFPQALEDNRERFYIPLYSLNTTKPGTGSLDTVLVGMFIVFRNGILLIMNVLSHIYLGAAYIFYMVAISWVRLMVCVLELAYMAMNLVMNLVPGTKTHLTLFPNGQCLIADYEGIGMGDGGHGDVAVLDDSAV
jgi:hypothetical protein